MKSNIYILVIILLLINTKLMAIEGVVDGTLILTHGFQLNVGEDEGLETNVAWLVNMAKDIAAKNDNNSNIYQLTDGKIVLHQAVDTSSKNSILLFDWIEESDHNCEGYAEAAADALAALMIKGANEGKWSLDNLHYIGHSRGAIVNSEAIQRLLYYASHDLLPKGMVIDRNIHMTTLDPHAAGNWMGIGESMNDNSVNSFEKSVVCPSWTSGFDSKQKKCGVVVWKGGSHKNLYSVSFSDNYYQTNSIITNWGVMSGLKKYEGLKNEHPANNDLGKLDGIMVLNGMDHSKVHEWYHGTINSDKGRDSWYLSNSRLYTGFNVPLKLINTNTHKDVNDDSTLDEYFYIFNGDLEYSCFRKDSIDRPGWSFHGGGGRGQITDKGLSFDRGNPTRTHNIFYIPRNASKIIFDYGTDDIIFKNNSWGLRVNINEGTYYKLFYNEPIGNKRYKGVINIPEELKSTTAKIKFTFLGGGERKDVFTDVLVKDIRMITEDDEVGLEGNDVALILDGSGSMSKKENVRDESSPLKIERAKQAVRALIAAMSELDEVSISTFSDKGDTPLPMEEVGIVEGELENVFSKITPSGGTNIGDGLNKGLEELKKVSNNQKMAILLSDGEHNVGAWGNVLKVVGDYEKEKWPLCTMGFGKDANEKKLKRIARDTGCVYKYVETLDLINSFQELSAYAQNNSIILSVRDLLLSREILNYGFNVEKNAKSFNVYTSWQGSKLSTKLISPNGKVIIDAEARSTGGRYEEGKTFQMLEVEEPVPGLWNIEVSWAEAPPMPEQVNISVAEKSDIFTWMNGFRPMYSINEAVTINVNAANVVNNKKVPLRGGAVTAEIIKPGADIIRMVQAQSAQWTMFKDVLQNNIRKVTLYDDGNHHDYKAGDGVFGGIYRETDKNGAYLVNATIRGEKQNGEPLEKLIAGSFQVGPITNNPVTSSQSMKYTREARRHFQQQNPTLQQIENTIPLDGIEQLENSADPLEAIDQLNGGDPLESIDDLMRSGG